MIKGFFFGLLIAATTLAVYLVVHLGVFLPVAITEEERGPYHTLFQNHQGAYYRISAKIAAVEKLANEMSLDCALTFGEYLDDPNEAEEDRLRSRGGCLSTHPYATVPEGCELGEISKQRFVVAHFSGSPAIGPWKVYGKVRDYMRERRLQASSETIEIYAFSDGTISTEYLFPLK